MENNFDYDSFSEQQNNIYDYGEYDNWEEDTYAPAGTGLAVTGMVFGIVALAIDLLSTCCCSSMLGGIVSAIFAIAGLIVSIFGLKERQSKGMCIAGIVCSIVALFAAVVYVTMMGVYFLWWEFAPDGMNYYTF